MKKILFSFFTLFCIFISVNNCYAFTVQGDGVSVDIPDDYVSYVCLKGSNDSSGFILASKVKGIFKKNWVSAQGSYMYYFYPDGSNTYTTYVQFAINSGYNMSGPTTVTCLKFANNTILQGNTTIMYGTVNPNGSQVSGDIIYEPKEIDSSIGNPDSRLQLTYEYNPEFTECKINATIIDGSFTDKIYYSNYQPGVTGNLLTKKGFPTDGIIVTKNQSLFFQAEDKDGNVIATNSISIFKIGKLIPEDFVVTFDTIENGKLYFTSLLKDSGYIYNDIYCKIESSDINSIRVLKNGELTLGSHSEEFLNYKLISSGSTWQIINMTTNSQKLKISFMVKNRETDSVMLTKEYNCTINVASNSSIDGGIINSGKDDEQITTPENDNNFGLGFEGITESSSMTDLVNSARGTFETFKVAFSILPAFIWAIISGTLLVIIVLRILGR